MQRKSAHLPRRKFFQNTIALVYDFDGTLSPQPMQEYTVLPKIGIDSKTFWERVNKEAHETGSDSMLVYMRLMLREANKREVSIKREDFAKLAGSIEYFPGVETWFSRINAYVKRRGAGKIKVQHYIISAGQKEILDGVSIRKHFKQIYASEYHFDHNGVADFPKVLINDTTKTQFLFRVNKGREVLNESINEHMPEHQRPIPFSNMIYIGDGMSDVPSMALTKKNGGHTIAVHDPKKEKGLEQSISLMRANRVDLIAPADYRKGSKLALQVALLLDAVIANIAYDEEIFGCKVNHGLHAE
jgi:2-hydroxy-3-keto-5-methylthiopentenyl-1-phosphate phosphatase